MSEQEQQRDKIEMLKEFYNYKNWRAEQRKQLTISSNIFFTFNVATLAFVINYLIMNSRYESLNYVVVNLFLLSIFLFVLSIIAYILFNLLRLADYRKTAKYIKAYDEYEEIAKKTRFIGDTNWILFYIQVGLSVIGLLMVLFTFYQIMFSK